MRGGVPGESAPGSLLWGEIWQFLGFDRSLGTSSSVFGSCRGQVSHKDISKRNGKLQLSFSPNHFYFFCDDWVFILSIWCAEGLNGNYVGWLNTFFFFFSFKPS